MIGNDDAMHGPVTHAGGRKPEKAKSAKEYKQKKQKYESNKK